MRLFFLLVIGQTLFAQSTDRYLHVMGGFLKGSDYLVWNAQQRAAYAAGFVNGMTVAALVLNEGDSPQEPKWLAACVAEMSDRQIAEIIRKEVQDKPAQWHLGMNTLSFNAMVGACAQYTKPRR